MYWENFPFPAFVKPVHEGSSKGIRFGSRVESEAIARVVGDLLERYRQPVMVEEFIAGDEVTVGMVGNPPAVIGAMRIVPRQSTLFFVYSLEVKRDWQNLVDYESGTQLKTSLKALLLLAQ